MLHVAILMALVQCCFLLLTQAEYSRSWESKRQNKPPEVFCKTGVLRNFAKFRGKHLCQSLFFKTVASLRPAALLKMRLWHRCFPVNLAKFLRTAFLAEHLRWLPLKRAVTLKIIKRATSFFLDMLFFNSATVLPNFLMSWAKNIA